MGKAGAFTLHIYRINHIGQLLHYTISPYGLKAGPLALNSERRSPHGRFFWFCNRDKGLQLGGTIDSDTIRGWTFN